MQEFAARVMNVHCDNTVVYFPGKLKKIKIKSKGLRKDNIWHCYVDNPYNSADVRDTTKERQENLTHSVEMLKAVRSLLKVRKVLIWQLPNKI